MLSARRFHKNRGESDPYWSNVSLLLHGDGANGSTTITDSTGKNTLTAVGNAQISTAQSKFGGSGLYFDGSGDYVSFPSTANASLDADFTVECFFYCISKNQYAKIIASGNASMSGNAGALGVYGYDNKVWFANPTHDGTFRSTSTINDGQWYHLAITRSGSALRMFVAGILEATATDTSIYDLGLSGTRIGASGWDGSNGHWNGYIDELRITKGVARYTANFTPPSAPFPNQ